MEVNISLSNGYKIKTITKDNNFYEVFKLCERCSDYYLLHDGTYPVKEDAEEIFTSLPPNNTYDDKFVLGVFEMDNRLIGLAEIVKNYPVIDSWIIGLLFIDPDERGSGLGREVHKVIRALAVKSGVRLLRLCAVEENIKGVNFWSSLGYKTIKQESREYKKKTHMLYIMVMDL